MGVRSTIGEVAVQYSNGNGNVKRNAVVTLSAATLAAIVLWFANKCVQVGQVKSDFCTLSRCVETEVKPFLAKQVEINSDQKAANAEIKTKLEGIAESLKRIERGHSIGRSPTQ